MSEIIVGRYDGRNKEEFYRGDGKEIVRVITEYGRMWVPIVNPPGYRSASFDPDDEIVLVFLIEEDYKFYSGDDEDGEYADAVFGLIVQNVPHMRLESTREKKMKGAYDASSNSPTKVLVDSDSNSNDYYVIGSGEYQIVVAKDRITIKGPGGEIGVGKEGIISRGRKVDMDFFGGSKAGVLKESWLGSIIPSSVVTPFPNYRFDETLITRVSNMAADISSIVG